MSANQFVARFAGMVAALVAPESQAIFEMNLAQAQAAYAVFEARANAEPAVMTDSFWYAPDDWRASYRPYVVKDGILQIPVKGVLLNDFSFALGSWATGYTYIWKAFERGMADVEVKGIALICHTPGGEVAGNFDLVDKMYALMQANPKPVRAFAHEAAYSAGYSIASVANHIAVSRTGGVGSIGVVTAHMDVSQAMAENGYKITFIYAGKHKVDGNPYEALSADVKARIQGRIDALYDVFVSTVARNRSVLSEQEVRDTEALTFTAAEAVSNKLADSIGSLDDAVAAFAADLSSDQGDEKMADQAETTAADQAAAQQRALDAARAEGVTVGVAAERSRITAIINGDAAKDRPVAALAAALETDMTADQAATFLAKLPAEPKAEAAAPPADTGTPGGGTDAFTKKMETSEHPDLGGGNAPEGKGSRAERAFAAAGRTKAAA